MNTYTGEVVVFQSEEELKKVMGLNAPDRAWKPIDPKHLTDALRQQLEAEGRIHLSRNSACPCGSGKRFKSCCYSGPPDGLR